MAFSRKATTVPKSKAETISCCVQMRSSTGRRMVIEHKMLDWR